jgi:hypothetical protein
LHRYPNLIADAVAFYHTITHPDKHNCLGATINLFAVLCRLPAPLPFEEGRFLPTQEEMDKVTASKTPPFYGANCTLDPHNIHHFIALMSARVRGWWKTYFVSCLSAITGLIETKEGGLVGAEKTIEVFLTYLATEGTCGGLRWYGSNGICMDHEVISLICVQHGLGIYQTHPWEEPLVDYLHAYYNVITRSGSEAF